MKKFIFILFISLFLFFGCAAFSPQQVALTESPCPAEDVVWFILLPDGPTPVMLKEDWFRMHPEGWRTLEEYNKMQDEIRRQEQGY